MADDKQKVTVLLTLLRETCSASITPLSAPPSALDSSSNPASVLYKDFLSLLSLIYASATKVFLTLRPSEPAYSASRVPIQEITAQISSLTTCATLFDAHGKTLAETVRRSATEVCESVMAFAQGFLNIINGTASSASSSQLNDDCLVRTGAVHECVERIRKTLPESNVAAVRSTWSQDKAMLDDSLAEVNVIMEGGGDAGGESDDEGFEDDDLLDELGLGPTKRLSDVEVERVKKVQPLLRLITLLYKRVLLDVLNQVNSFVTGTMTSLDDLPHKSRQLLSASDDLIATLYAPQNPGDISSAITSFTTVVDTIREALEPLLPSPPSETEKLATQFSEVSIQGAAKNRKDVRKWYSTCFEQFRKLSVNVVDALSVGTNTT